MRRCLFRFCVSTTTTTPTISSNTINNTSDDTTTPPVFADRARLAFSNAKWRDLTIKEPFLLDDAETSDVMSSLHGWTHDAEAKVLKKEFELGDVAGLYEWFGRCLKYVHMRTTVNPKIVWFYTSATVTFALDQHNDGDGRAAIRSDQAQVAAFMDDTEREYSMRRNTSKGVGFTGIVWPDETRKAVADATDSFKQMYHQDKNRRESFINSNITQWTQRSDYLVRRYSREKIEFRQTMTFDDMLKSSPARRRRKERIQMRIKEQNQAAVEEEVRRARAEEQMNEDENAEQDSDPIMDVWAGVPREKREFLQAEFPGDHDVRAYRQGLSPMATGRTLY
eukprot:PhM_4_TR3338/c0_g1_i1/m.12819